jgi:hypothetical protein
METLSMATPSPLLVKSPEIFKTSPLVTSVFSESSPLVTSVVFSSPLLVGSVVSHHPHSFRV